MDARHRPTNVSRPGSPAIAWADGAEARLTCSDMTVPSISTDRAVADEAGDHGPLIQALIPERRDSIREHLYGPIDNHGVDRDEDAEGITRAKYDVRPRSEGEQLESAIRHSSCRATWAGEGARQPDRDVRSRLMGAAEWPVSRHPA